jgi:phosphoglycolate phosphatase
MGLVRGVVFDLDGVLVDSLPSIVACLNDALVRLGRPGISVAEARPMVGPPIEETAAKLMRSDDAAEIARFVGLYRERYARTCTLETLPAAGLREVLQDAGRSLAAGGRDQQAGGVRAADPRGARGRGVVRE